MRGATRCSASCRTPAGCADALLGVCPRPHHTHTHTHLHMQRAVHHLARRHAAAEDRQRPAGRAQVRCCARGWHIGRGRLCAHIMMHAHACAACWRPWKNSLEHDAGAGPCCVCAALRHPSHPRPHSAWTRRCAWSRPSRCALHGVVGCCRRRTRQLEVPACVSRALRVGCPSLQAAPAGMHSLEACALTRTPRTATHALKHAVH
jgi:hypothetical protein